MNPATRRGSFLGFPNALRVRASRAADRSGGCRRALCLWSAGRFPARRFRQSVEPWPGSRGVDLRRDLSHRGVGSPGRPISYLSFLLQSGSWPHDPLAFKLVNIALHVANGALVYAVVARTLALLGRADAAVLGDQPAAAWLVHPIQVSTVLYVVQRMTELAALFCLGGMLAYLRGRVLARSGRVDAGYAWMSAGLALGTPLAILAKENGALLPVYIAVIELTLLSGVPRPPRWKLWAAVFLAFLPLRWRLTLRFRAAGSTATPSVISRFPSGSTPKRSFSGTTSPRSLAQAARFRHLLRRLPGGEPPWSSAATAAALAGGAQPLPLRSRGDQGCRSSRSRSYGFLPATCSRHRYSARALFRASQLPAAARPGPRLGVGREAALGAASTPGMRRVYASLGTASAWRWRA